jgi:hypothetical protein
MDARLDSAFETWGKFTKKMDEAPAIPGRLSYDPFRGVALELVENREGSDVGEVLAMCPIPVLFGQLVDGTLVTLLDCIITKTSLGAGAVGLPTALIANRALLGANIADIDDLKLKSYTVEFSSLSNWMCVSPASLNMVKDDAKLVGVDICFRRPDPIHVVLPNRSFDLQISHDWKTSHTNASASVRWHAGIAIQAHEEIAFRDASHVAWQCQNLMGLLIGQKLSLRSVTITPHDNGSAARTGSPFKLVYHQRGKHDESDAHPSRMLLPYDSIKENFAGIVDKWFARSEQAVLAANVFFGSQLLESPAVNVKFLAVVQAAESYHRALGTGVYMDQAEYDEAIEQLHLPESIQGDHRHSLRNRLKYLNEYSLRKRLTDLFDRLPENVRLRIADNVPQFVGKIVDTRNYYTHYDHEAQQRAFEGQDAFVAAERLRVLVVAYLLHDLGIEDEKLLSVLERSREFKDWMCQDLPLG